MWQMRSDITICISYVYDSSDSLKYVTWFWKTNQVVTNNEISRNTDFKYWSYHGSLVLDYNHNSVIVWLD